MAGSLKTEAIVLRSIRFGEADRVLHLYTPQRGRVSAIAKGVRRAKSRFGGRLEPFFRLQLVLYEGRSDLLTVTSRRDAGAAIRACARTAAALDTAARACDAVGRLFDDGDPHAGVYDLLCQRARPAQRRPGAGGPRQRARLPPQAAARRRLLAPARRLRLLRRRASTSRASPARPAAWSARPAKRARSRSTRRPTASSSRPSAARSPRPPPPSPRALAQAERAILETLEHHANVRLRSVSTLA